MIKYLLSEKSIMRMKKYLEDENVSRGWKSTLWGWKSNKGIKQYLKDENVPSGWKHSMGWELQGKGWQGLQ